MAYPLSASAQAWQARARDWLNCPLRPDGVGRWANEMQRTALARSVRKGGLQGVMGL
jgi:hypothetical protein